MNELDAELKDYIEDNQDIEKTPYIIKQKEKELNNKNVEDQEVN